MKRPALGWAVLIFSLTALASQWFRHSWHYGAWNPPAEFGAVLHAVFIIQAILSIIMLISAAKVVFYVAWGISVLSVLVFHYFFSALGFLSLTFAIIVILHIALYEHFPVNLILAMAFSTLSRTFCHLLF